MHTSELRRAAATGVFPVSEQRTIDDILPDLQQQLSFLLSHGGLSSGGPVVPWTDGQSRAPLAVEVRVKHLELIGVQDAFVLLVLVLQGGRVQEQVLMVDVPSNQERLSRAAAALNRRVEGRTADGVDQVAQMLPLGLERDTAEAIAQLMATHDQHDDSPALYQDDLASERNQRMRSVNALVESQERQQAAPGTVRLSEMLQQGLLLRCPLPQPSSGVDGTLFTEDHGEGP